MLFHHMINKDTPYPIVRDSDLKVRMFTVFGFVKSFHSHQERTQKKKTFKEHPKITNPDHGH